MNIAPRALGVALAAATLMAVSWISRAPMRLSSGDGAVVRISLGARPERIENCRTQTDEELAKLAPQMRQRVVCEGVTARYLLEVRHDRTVLWSQVVRGGGLRHDRQLYVSRAIPVPAGAGSYRVSLHRVDTVDARAAATPPGDTGATIGTPADTGPDLMLGRSVREAEARSRRREEVVPATLDLSVEANLETNEVLLFTYDPEQRILKAVRAPRASGAKQ